MLFVPLSPRCPLSAVGPLVVRSALSALSAVVDWPGSLTTKEPRAAVEYTRTGWGS